MSRLRFVTWLLAIFAVAVTLRVLWLRSDPPTVDSVGVVWHDEGAWVHNARNRAVWGVWRTDAWNPVFVAPVFTALEYGAFTVFGVGTWQARVVPVASGLVAVSLLLVGLHAAAGRRAAVIGGLLLATNYTFVMWNRAALMESTMTTFIVCGWCAYTLSERRPAWGIVAGAAAVLAWFTKASAAFFVGALVLDALIAILASRKGEAGGRTERRAAILTLAGIGLTASVIAVLFVLPNWVEYRFYNWQMSVTRKPDTRSRHSSSRASWLPIAHDLFTRMWLVLLVAVVGLLAIVGRWRQARAAERLLVLWVIIGLAELVVHDSGNARRYVMFIPALVALAALALSWRPQAVPLSPITTSPMARVVAVPMLLLFALSRHRQPPQTGLRVGGRRRAVFECRPRFGGPLGSGGCVCALAMAAGGSLDHKGLGSDSSCGARARCHARDRTSSNSRVGPDGAARRTTKRRWRSAGSSRPAHSCMASSPTAWRSRIQFGRCLSATDSATTTTA